MLLSSKGRTQSDEGVNKPREKSMSIFESKERLAVMDLRSKSNRTNRDAEARIRSYFHSLMKEIGMD